MLCHEASNNLCPSKRLEIPAFPLHGSNFTNGVKFSVQTTSPGRVPCKRCSRSLVVEWSPIGSKDTTGLDVRVESIKFREAQNSPERDWVRDIHFAKALNQNKSAFHKYRMHLLITHASSVAASIHAQSSTPVPPSLNPFHGLVPQLSASHLPVVKRRCSSRVFVCWRICPNDRGKYRKFCCSNANWDSLLLKLNEARREDGGRGWRSSRSW